MPDAVDRPCTAPSHRPPTRTCAGPAGRAARRIASVALAFAAAASASVATPPRDPASLDVPTQAIPEVRTPPAPPPTIVPAPAPAAPAELPEVVVSAPEPRYVAPTNRDGIGRVWAPVYIDDRGPFRLVLDTGASASAITPAVVAALGRQPDPRRRSRLYGVTGSADVQMVRTDGLRVGDLEIEPAWLAVVADAFGGAEGVLGNHGFRDKRIFIDFRRDRITIRRSRSEKPEPGMSVVPVELTSRSLLVVPARVGNVPVKAVIDTGGQVTLGNEALRAALERARLREPRVEEIVGASQEVATATSLATPPIWLGSLQIRNARIAFADMYIFEHWRMTREPALLIGMDVLGVLEQLVIDYRRRELHVRL